jgi:RNA polymerase sigma factor (sigma-70 family)
MHTKRDPDPNASFMSQNAAVPSTSVCDEDAPAASSGAASRDDAALFEAFIGGDDRAFLELYKRHNPRLLLYTLKILGDRPRAEDVTQESWERMITMRGSGQPLRNPMGFLLRVARNLCIDAMRARRHHVALDDLHEASHPKVSPEPLSELESLALESLEQLPFEQREVLVLNYYCGYRFEEIATMLGRTPEAVWARASRGRARLRQIVSDALANEEKRRENR